MNLLRSLDANKGSRNFEVAEIDNIGAYRANKWRNVTVGEYKKLLRRMCNKPDAEIVDNDIMVAAILLMVN